MRGERVPVFLPCGRGSTLCVENRTGQKRVFINPNELPRASVSGLESLQGFLEPLRCRRAFPSNKRASLHKRPRGFVSIRRPPPPPVAHLSGKSLPVEEVLRALGVLAPKMEADLLQPVAVPQRAPGDVHQVGFVRSQGHVLAGVVHGASHLFKERGKKTLANIRLSSTRGGKGGGGVSGRHSRRLGESL